MDILIFANFIWRWISVILFSQLFFIIVIYSSHAFRTGRYTSGVVMISWGLFIVSFFIYVFNLDWYK